MDARYEEILRDEAYRLYISDTLYYYTHNQMLNMRYRDMINPQKTQSKMSGDDVVKNLFSEHNLRFKE